MIYRLIQIALLLLSAVTTTIGLKAWVPGQFPLFGIDLIWIIAAVLVAALTYLQWLFLERAIARLGGYARRSFSLLAYLVIVFVSVSFAYGSYWSLFSWVENATTAFTGLLDAVTTSEEEATKAIKDLGAESLSLKTFSEDRAKLEEEQGNSCDNQNTEPGPGPVKLERDAITDAIVGVSNSLESDLDDAVKTFAEGIASTREEIMKIMEINDVEKFPEDILVQTQRINDAIKKYNDALIKLKTDQSTTLRKIFNAVTPTLPDEDPLTKVMRTESEASDSPFPDRAKCDDTELAGEVDKMINALEQIAALQEIDSTKITNVNPITIAMQDYFRTVSNLLGYASARPTSPINVLALVAAIFVDAFIMVFGVLVPRRLFPPGTAEAWVNKTFDPESRTALEELIRSFSVASSSGSTYVALPTSAWSFVSNTRVQRERERPSQSALLSRLNSAVQKLKTCRVIRSARNLKDDHEFRRRLDDLGWKESGGKSDIALFVVIDTETWDELKSTYSIPSKDKGRPAPTPTKVERPRYQE